MAQMVKNLPAVEESWVQSLGQEDPLENGMATHSSILGWRIPWTEEPGGLQSIGFCKESDTAERLTVSLFRVVIGLDNAECLAHCTRLVNGASCCNNLRALSVLFLFS